MKKNVFLLFLFQTQKCPFWGVNKFVLYYFFSLSFKNNRHTNIICIGNFENTQKSGINPYNCQNGVFESQ